MDGNDAHFYPLIQTYHFRTDSVLWCGLLEQLFRTIDFFCQMKSCSPFSCIFGVS